MFETLDLDIQLDKDNYKQRMDRIDLVLPLLQRRVFEHKVPVVVLFEGWYASGRGDAIARLVHRCDPRGSSVHVTHASRDDFRFYPWMWRFWGDVPSRGRLQIFDRSWYYLLWNSRFDGHLAPTQWEQRLAEIDDFERQLADDGTVIIKFWMHISQKEQEKRLKSWAKDETQQWRVSDEDWKRHKNFSERLVLAEEMLARTHTHRAPWTLVEAEDERHRRVKVLTTVIDSLRRALQKRGIPEEDLEPLPEVPPEGETLAPISAEDTLPDPLVLSQDSLLERAVDTREQ